MSAYATIFADVLRQLEREEEVHPSLVEAWVRLEYSTLDHLDHPALVLQTEIALECLVVEGVEASVELARSYGLPIACDDCGGLLGHGSSTCPVATCQAARQTREAEAGR